MTTAFARRGLIAGYGSAWMLPRLLGPMNAIDFLFTARILLCEEATQLGLARSLPTGRLSPGGAALRDCSRRAIVAAFAQDHQGAVWAGLSQSLAEASVLADAEMLESMKSADFREGIRHFVEQREPTFTGS